MNVLRCIARAVTIFALCCAIGLQWLALQSIAWTAMIVDYSKHYSLGQAIVQTLDGAHPCSLCYIVSKGKACEKRSDLQPLAPKFDIICTKRAITLLRPFVHFQYLVSDFSFSEIRRSPPVPPPRSFLS
ncbi:MAG: hypothetical protein DME33_14340 [Verrucomicrobia bacterium]|nr:MAG: hypothetical protein DME33_14340 [Verrucomicrobiota bacterium]